MKDKIKVTYIRHSGFLVETANSYLLFDYWKGTIPPMEYKKSLYVFSSHGHKDHYTKDIFKLENKCESVYYILSSDIESIDGSWKKTENVYFMKPHESLEIDGICVDTLLSTDEGVAFLVKADGKTIYHAGDLHWWHWYGEPDEDNEWQRETFQKEVGYLAGKTIDCAFVVLDPRQEDAGEWGMDYFLKHVESRYIFPMHLWEDYDFIQKYKDKKQRKNLFSRIVNITKQGQEFLLDI